MTNYSYLTELFHEVFFNRICYYNEERLNGDDYGIQLAVEATI